MTYTIQSLLPGLYTLKGWILRYVNYVVMHRITKFWEVMDCIYDRDLTSLQEAGKRLPGHVVMSLRNTLYKYFCVTITYNTQYSNNVLFAFVA